jgi:hypothetical protein
MRNFGRFYKQGKSGGNSVVFRQYSLKEIEEQGLSMKNGI